MARIVDGDGPVHKLWPGVQKPVLVTETGVCVCGGEVGPVWEHCMPRLSTSPQTWHSFCLDVLI